MFSFSTGRSTQHNMGILGRFLMLVVALVFIYTVLFHGIMDLEGQHHSWLTGLYWTLTVMTTLGFGDITFTSDTGRLFSLLVLVTGIVLFLTVLPFFITQFFYQPWLEAQNKRRTPRSLPPDTRGHVIVANPGPVGLNLVDELVRYGASCTLLCTENQKANDLFDRGYSVVLGEHDSSEVYANLRLSNAAMLVALDTDERNTNIVFTAREQDGNVPIVAMAQREEAIDLLQLAGCTHVFQFHKLLGEALARRVLNNKARCSVISRFEGLVIAEAPVMRTPLVGKSLRDCDLRKATGVNVVGLWERGNFLLPRPDTVFTNTMVMVMAASQAQIDAMNEHLGEVKSARDSDEESPVVIIGCGRVGLAAARYLKASGRDYRIIDKVGKAGIPPEKMIVGDASDLIVLENAQLRTAPSVLITTHEDDTNMYLTLYCRRLCKDTQIISRANLDRNVPMLHTAGADLVISMASLLCNSIVNLLSPGKVLMINEGLNIFRHQVGESLLGHELRGSGIRSGTNCSVIALRTVNGEISVNPDPAHIFAADEELFIIGDSKSEKAFYATFGQGQNGQA